MGQGLTLGAGVRWQSEIHSDNQGPNGARFTQGGYAVVDAMARYALTRQLAATLNLYNLTDKEYYATTGNAYYGEPLSVRLGVEARF
ncbi:TonB-dependent receptor domain-containing protein [Alloalcanivorax mobilis]|uniref:TonB-dependent receptor domain-containing protein n=1 Tax=Alloalcanivorax mobilis TaxID=2019569 RepID=UPI0018E482A2|nr:TonB-dependent receptor [Alloalcanivorax mobilis]